MAKIKANNKGLKLRLDLALEPDDLVEADKGKFGQIITNLLGNAVKFTDSGVITLQAKREHDDIEIAVEDHGPGISAEDQAQLFSVFNQGRAGEIHGGTGLGLTLSRRLAEMMGGSISLHSSLGQGTRVVLTAPWPRQTIKNLPTQPTLEQTRIDGHGLTVLVVEDDAMSIDILANYLRALNFTVLTATSGESGWQLAQQQTQLSAIFTDIRMAEMSGLGLLDLCKDHPILSKVPTIAVSASSLEHERQHFLEHGFDDFVAKPIDFTLLDGVIAQHVMGAVVALADQNPTLATHPTNPEEIKELNSEELLAACDAILIAAANGDVQQARMDADKSRQQHWLDQATQNQLDDALARYDLAAVEALIKAIKAEVAQLES